MSAAENLNYFLFPHTILSTRDFRNLRISLPRLNIMEIIQHAAIPKWGRKTFAGWSVLGSQELSDRIGSCVRAYRSFAEIHGSPGGTLGFLSRALDEIDEPRYQIQEQLRGKRPPEMDAEEKEIIQAAVFLEIARELDEKELELESNYTHLSAIEREFRDILGIEEEESEPVETDLTPPLAHDTNGLLYMLPKRIVSWFRMLSLKPIEKMPVFVSCFPAVIEETLEMVRSACEGAGKEFASTVYPLGAVPRVDMLGEKQFQTLVEAPGIPELLSSCYRGLENTMKAANDGVPELIQERSWSLKNELEKLCRNCDMAEGDKVSLNLILLEKLTLNDVLGFLGANPVFGTEAWPAAFLSVDLKQSQVTPFRSSCRDFS